MTRVCVIGCGSAGAEAAEEAARGGGDVTVLDVPSTPDTPWRLWPDLITGSGQGPRTPPAPGPERSRVRVVPLEAGSFRSGAVMYGGRGWVRFDSIVVAAGCRFAPVHIEGAKKPGVCVLDSAEAYASLGRRLDSASQAIVFGDGGRGLEVADRLSGGGRDVRLAIPHWRTGEPGQVVRDALLGAAAERGVSVLKGTVTKAVGEGSLEAAVVGGRVECCDILAVLPARVPRLVPSAALLGSAGGLSVDRCLRTSLPSVLAAGGCAEVTAAPLCSSPVGDDPKVAGRIAGANAVGHHHAVSQVVRSETVAFGLRWTRISDRFGPCAGSAAAEVSDSWGSDSACTIAYDRRSGKVMHLEWVEEASHRSALGPLVSAAELSLRGLAYGGSSDISLISDTARLGLSQWSQS